MTVRIFWAMLLVVCAGVGATAARSSAEVGAVDRLDRSAPTSLRVERNPLFGIAKAGQRLVAVGVRGLIAVSDDQGSHWRQVPSPVAVDLLAVQFPSPKVGWVVGHDGVVLHSNDGGLSWHKQLDGRQAATLLTQHYASAAAAGDAAAQRMLPEVKLNYQDGPEQALTDLWFEDEQRGFVVGSFGTLLRTEDGGRTWQSWMERVDSAELLHLNAIRQVGDDVYIASERGLLFRLDRQAQRFVPVSSGYNGSFFAVTGSADVVMAAGLRGNALRSTDGGHRWEPVVTGAAATFTAAEALPDGRLLLLSQDGRVLLGSAQATEFRPLPVERVALLTAATLLNDEAVALVGLNGFQRVRLPSVR